MPTIAEVRHALHASPSNLRAIELEAERAAEQQGIPYDVARENLLRIYSRLLCEVSAQVRARMDHAILAGKTE